MEKQIMVTIFITNYNYAAYIEKSIQSVLNQSYKDLELLIIDDGSTDNSKDIIEKYRHLDFVTIIYQKNKGLNITNNIALRTSKGKYIMRLDADDYIEPDAIAAMVEVLESDEELGLVFPNYYYVDKNENIIGTEIRHDFETDVDLFDQPAHGACTMIRKSFLIEQGGYNESFTCQDGYDLWLKFITNHKVTNIAKPLFYYRQHGSNLTTNENRILDTRKKIKDTFIKSGAYHFPKTIAIIPLRSKYINGHNWPIFETNGISVLEKITTAAAACNLIEKVILTTSDNEIINYIKDKKIENENIRLIVRPEKYAQVNESLNNTFNFILENEAIKAIQPEAILTVYTEYPFVTPHNIEDAINTLVIFKADSLISVRPDNRTYYQHTGSGMTPILDQNKFTKLEREALYKGAGGILLTRVDNLKEQNILAGKVGHIVVNELESFGVFSKLDFDLYQLMQ